MNIPRSPEVQTNVGLAWDMGDVMYTDYWREGPLGEVVKPNGTIALETDLKVSDEVVAFLKARGRNVVSEEEGRTAEYGALNAEYLDPIDGTDDFKNSRLLLRHLRQSIGAFSLGSAVNGRIVRGVINLPVLCAPRLYWAEEAIGSFRVMRRNGPEERLEINPDLRRGVVLASANEHPYKERLRKMGFTVIGLDGIVFKAACVADTNLLHDFDPALIPTNETVVGMLSDSAQPHDYAAAKALAGGAGAVACGVDGGTLPLVEGKHGCVFANSGHTRDLLLEALGTR
ncbi:MAG TPA: inositol monophosphatase family protein [Candidatus Saccharimonadales bacterium]|nr:inositol monophosphatase family protein [Candidatus Saccharimonadales bacterium]